MSFEMRLGNDNLYICKNSIGQIDSKTYMDVINNEEQVPQLNINLVVNKIKNYVVFDYFCHWIELAKGIVAGHKSD